MSLRQNFWRAACKYSLLATTFLTGIVFLSFALDAAEPTVRFPSENWNVCAPEEVGLESEKLMQFAANVGGDGCLVRNGSLVFSWGDIQRHKDWASAAKPVLSTLLMIAVQEGKLPNVDAPVIHVGWKLSDKDSTMTFRHLANMVSGYGLDEQPGTAWGYNDFAIQLYAKSLEQVFGQPLDEVIRDRLRELQFQDGEFFGSRSGLGVTASSRDFARLGWLWLNRGLWNGKQLIDAKIFDDCIRTGVPNDLPQAVKQSNDYLSVGSYGGGTTQTPFGPGCYGFNLWFNERLSDRERVWPALPGDAYQANGLWNRDTVTVIPSLQVVLAVRGAKPAQFEPGRVEGEYNQNLKLVMDAIAVNFQPIDLSGFASGIHHWRKIRDESRFIQVEKNQASYAPHQVREIANNILLFQRSNGGWPKDYDMSAVLSGEQIAKIKDTKTASDTSYDNGNVYSQIDYLAKAYHQHPEATWRTACEQGFDFVIQSQYTNGGFPQRFPNPKSYHSRITFNDGVTIGVLKVLVDAAERAPHFAWLDERRRTQAADAVARGIECILNCQIKIDGRLTGWCQQHDAITFDARPARSFELASLCPQETVEIIHFLSQTKNTSSRIQESIHAANSWLREVQLDGLRVERIKANPESFLRHDADFDVVVVPDPNAPPLWARHYEIGTNRPIFAGRDGIKKYSLAEIERERRTGTPWYGRWPASLLNTDLLNTDTKP